MTWHNPDGTRRRQPVFNAPTAVVWMVGALVLSHVLLTVVLVWIFGPGYTAWLAESLAFIPQRFSETGSLATGVDDSRFFGGALTKWTSLVSHMFLHGGWMHLIFNSVWLLIFGTPVASRLGTSRFLLLFGLCGIAGAAAHGLAGWMIDTLTGGPPGTLIGGRLVPDALVGASGAISGLMGAAARFIVLGPAMAFAGYNRPLLPLNDNQVVTFTVLWVAINMILALTGGMGLASGGGISWEAHLGGYFAGLFLISVIDRR